MTLDLVVLPALRPLLLSAGRLLLDGLLPPRCLGCGVAVAAPGALCGTCWEGLAFITPPLCGRCGLPFETAPQGRRSGRDHDAGELFCGDCIRRPPPYARARSALRYDAASRELILRFKHADRTDAAPAFAAWMALSGGPLLSEADVVVPVPLHRWRLLRRRYNQAALLALALARKSGLPCWPDLLLRTRNTASQGRLSPARRRRNVAGAFAVRRSRRAALKGLRVLLVDDVRTTGATLEACSRTLKAAGASEVLVLTLARVTRTEG